MKNNRAGFIQMILLILAALVLLKYVYKVDIVGFLTQGKPKEALDAFYGWAAQGWESYKDAFMAVLAKAGNLIKGMLSRAK